MILKKGKHIPKENLRVGMVMLCGDATHTSSNCWHNTDRQIAPSVITEINTENGFVYHEILNIDGSVNRPDTCACDDLHHLYLSEDFDYTTNTSITTIKENLITTTMANVISFFRSITATADEKLLKELNIEDPIGTPTADGLSLSAEITYKTNRAAIIEIAKQMKAEQDAAKK